MKRINWGNPISSHQLNNGLVNWWYPRLDINGNIIYDLCKNKDANLGPSFLSPTLKIVLKLGPNKVMDFDGINDYLYISSSTPLFNSDTPIFTLSGWFFLRSLKHYNAIFNQRDAGGGATYFLIDFDEFGNLQLFEVDVTGSPVNLGITGLSAGTWYYITIVRNGNNSSTGLTGYINGCIKGSATTGVLGTFTIPQSVFFGMGYDLNSAQLDGMLGDWRFYNRALLSSEVSLLYQDSLKNYPLTLNRTQQFWRGYKVPAAPTPSVTSTARSGHIRVRSRKINLGSPVNQSCGLNSGLVSWWLGLNEKAGGNTFYDLCDRNNALLSTNVKFTQGFFNSTKLSSIDFATGNGIYIPSSFQIKPPFTVCFRCVVPAGQNATVFSQAVGSYELLFDVGTAAVVGGLGFAPSALAGTDFSQSPVAHIPGTIHYYTLGYDGTTIYWYVDGINIGTTFPPTNNIIPGTTLRIGARANDTLPLTTKMDTFAYYSRLLTYSEIFQLYIDSLQGYPQTLNWRYIRRFGSLTNVSSGNYFNARYFAHRYFPGRYFPIPGTIADIILSGATSYQKQYAFAILLNILLNNQAQKNKNCPITFSEVSRNNVLRKSNLNLTISEVKSVISLVNKNLPIAENLSKQLNAIITKNHGFNISERKNLNTANNKTCSVSMSGAKNNFAQVNKNPTIQISENKNTNALINKKFTINIGLLYNLLGAGISLKDFSFAINLFGRKNNIALVNRGLPINIGETKNTALASNKTFGINLNLRKNTISLLNKLFSINIALNKNNNSLIGKVCSIGVNLVDNIAGFMAKRFSFVFGANRNMAATSNKNYPVHLTLLKSLLAANNKNFSIHLDEFLNTSGLKKDTFPIIFSIPKNIKTTLFKGFNFPVIIGLNELTGEVTFIDVQDGIDGDFWCIIKKINIWADTKSINTWTDNKSISISIEKA